MSKSKAKDETAEIAAVADTMAADDFDDERFTAESWREDRTRDAKAQIADPVGHARKSAAEMVEHCRASVSDALADLRVARLELKAAEAMLASLPDAPKPIPALKAAARATGRKHVE